MHSLKFSQIHFFITAIIAIGILGEIYLPHAASPERKTIEILPGAGSREISRLLEREGIIRSHWFFVVYSALRGESHLLKPGTYSFQNDSLKNIVASLVRGESREIEIVIPEGWNIKNIDAYFTRLGIRKGGEWSAFATRPPASLTDSFSALSDRKVQSLEGYFFPDTYRIFRETTNDDIALKMLANFEKKLSEDLREEIRRQKKTIFEIITMASLIEKEVAGDEDRAIVSGILWKRIDMGIPLQVDATITYLTDKKSVKISREELAIDSPYNTYKYPGLPAGPISNPGLSAIRAAIYPNASPYLYYLSTPDGTTIFSRTLEEHNEAKRKYLR